MRKIALAVLVLAAAAVGGCRCASEAAFYKGVQGYADVILPEYEKYVDSDPGLKPDTKKIRKDSAAGLRRLLAEEKKALEDN